MKKHLYILLILAITVSSCSTKKSKFLNRAYHNTNAHFNAYFNGKESLKEGVKSVESSYDDNYKKILPIYRYPSDSGQIATQAKRAIEKGAKVIHKHSIYIKKQEYNNWVDDAYLMIGKSNFYKQEYELASENFGYVSKKYRSYQMKFEGLIWLTQTYIQQKDYSKSN